MNKILGIDLGTSYSLAAYDGKVIEETFMPSIFDTRSKGVGLDYTNDFDPLVMRSYKTDITIQNTSAIIAHTYILHSILKKAKGLGYPTDEVVIAVPAYFNTLQREATKKAADNLKVKAYIIGEPTAAALCNTQTSGYNLVVDIGGGTTDVTLLSIDKNKNSKVLATDGIPIGGDNIDDALKSLIFKDTLGVRTALLSKGYLRYIARGVKELIKTEDSNVYLEVKLDEVGDTSLNITCDDDPEGLVVNFEGNPYRLTEGKYSIDADTINSCIRTSLDKISNTLLKIISTKTDVILYNKVNLIFVGGSTKSPAVRSFVKSVISMANYEEVEVEDKMRAVAIGASIYPDFMDSASAKIVEITKGIGVGLKDNKVGFIIQPNSEIPATGTFKVENVDTTDTIVLDIYEGDRPFIEHCDEIGKLVIELGTLVPPSGAKVTIFADLEEAKLLNLVCSIPELGILKEITIR